MIPEPSSCHFLDMDRTTVGLITVDAVSVSFYSGFPLTSLSYPTFSGLQFGESLSVVVVVVADSLVG